MLSMLFGGVYGMIKTASPFFAFAALCAMVAPAQAQVRTVDPNAAMQSDLAPVPTTESNYGSRTPPPPPAASSAPAPATPAPAYSGQAANGAPAPVPPGGIPESAREQATASAGNEYDQQDVLTAAEGVFGKGAAGLANIIEKILKDQGRPNAYIAGREVSGAVVVGLRYGSGTLFHKIEGQRPVYWTGPSIGFDLGGNGAKTFMLVYNLYDSEDIYKRFPGGEGVVYVVGGFTASYQRIGKIVVIPIRLGVGWRLGANVGYLKFTKKSSILPF